MNSFDGITMTGANTARYLPILGDAAGIIGAYRKFAEPHKKYEPSPLGVGQTPLFLLDGELPAHLLDRAKEKLRLTAYVAIFRPFDVRLKKRLEETYRLCRGGGFIKKDGSVADWVHEDKRKAETEFLDLRLSVIQPYLDYKEALDYYNAAIAVPPVDAATGRKITGDLNIYLFERAKELFPLGVESVLNADLKQSAIPKSRFFIDGMKNAPAPKGVKRCTQDGQIALFDADKTSIDDTIGELRCFLKQRIERNGVVTLFEIITHCAEIGLYKGNVTLFAIGSSFRCFLKDNAIFYDGVCYWRYVEERDISSWFLRLYTEYEKFGASRTWKYAIFFDDTTLKSRLEWVFGIEPTKDKRLDTLGMAIMQIGVWIVENLHYPIAFLDSMLNQLYREHELYGEKLRRYDEYFTDERCAWLKSQLPQADTIARKAIEEAVGFDPDAREHNMSNLPKGHYAPVLCSAEDFIEEILRKPRVYV